MSTEKKQTETTKETDDSVEVVRSTDVTQGTEVAHLPHSDDPTDEAAEDSFPASDPPSFSGRKES